MKVGDLIKIKKGMKEELQITSHVGVILDTYEDMNTTHYEVQFPYERGWFDGFMLELVSNAK
jgi:hypothetical protein